jgi:hypothetical protein
MARSATRSRGVAAATAQFKNRVFVVGSQRTSDVPVRTDGAIWVYIADGKSVFIQPPVILKAPFTPDELEVDAQNQRSEKGPRRRDRAGNRQRHGRRRARILAGRLQRLQPGLHCPHPPAR